jgi:prephenate dehydrogenase
MEPWRSVAIVGVGLIGGSIGRALIERRLAERVVGVGRNKATLERAKELGAITQWSTDLAAGTAESEVVVVCTPVNKIAEQVREIAASAAAGTLITDAGSTKAAIVAAVGKLPPGVRFVGSHPLAGSEKTGVEHSTANLLEGRVVVVTPRPATTETDLEDVAMFWQSLGATVMAMSPAEHDRALATTSHVPHVVAAALAKITPAELLPLTAGGWRDTTRIAAGDAALWTEILLQNRDSVLRTLSRYEKTLAAFRTALERRQAARVTKLLAEAKQHRDALGS